MSGVAPSVTRGATDLERQTRNAIDFFACHVPPKVEVHREVRSHELPHDALAGEQLLCHVRVQLQLSSLMRLCRMLQWHLLGATR